MYKMEDSIDTQIALVAIYKYDGDEAVDFWRSYVLVRSASKQLLILTDIY